jgi:hypothetical protein
MGITALRAGLGCEKKNRTWLTQLIAVEKLGGSLMSHRLPRMSVDHQHSKHQPQEIIGVYFSIKNIYIISIYKI